MVKATTAERLRQLLTEKNMRQVDLLNLTQKLCEQYNVKMNRSDLSQYLADKTEPNQRKLFVLAKALNVSEAWLMGFDVPIERCEENKCDKPEAKELYTAYQRTDEGTKSAVRKLLDLG